MSSGWRSHQVPPSLRTTWTCVILIFLTAEHLLWYRTSTFCTTWFGIITHPVLVSDSRRGLLWLFQTTSRFHQKSWCNASIPRFEFWMKKTFHHTFQQNPSSTLSDSSLLFPGSNPTSAMSILGTSFNMDLAGKNAGSMFGPGIYMAESSTCLKTTTKMSVSENWEPMKTKVSDVFFLRSSHF